MKHKLLGKCLVTGRRDVMVVSTIFSGFDSYTIRLEDGRLIDNVKKIELEPLISRDLGVHEIQQRLIDLFDNTPEARSLGYRKVGQLIGVTHPQRVKYHILQLKKKGLI